MALKNRRMFELRLGKLGLLLFIIGMSFLLFSGFLTGVFVGKQLEADPELYASGVIALIRDRLFPPVPKAAGKGAPPPGEEKFDLTFYETLGGKKKAASAANPPGKENPAAPPAAAAQQRIPPIPADEGNRKKQAPNAEGPAPATGAQIPPASEAAAAPPQAKKSPPGNVRFEIQAAAYRERLQAEELVKKMAALGFSSQIVMKDLPGKGRWFRVIAEGFDSREAAQEAAERMVAGIRGLKCVIRAAGKNGNGN